MSFGLDFRPHLDPLAVRCSCAVLIAARSRKHPDKYGFAQVTGREPGPSAKRGECDTSAVLQLLLQRVHVTAFVPLISCPLYVSRPFIDSLVTIGHAFRFHVGRHIYLTSQAVIRSRHLHWFSLGVVFLSTVPKVSVMQSVDFPGYRSLYFGMDNSPYGPDLDPPLFSLSLPLHAPSFGPLRRLLACVVGSLLAFRRIKSLCMSHLVAYEARVCVALAVCNIALCALFHSTGSSPQHNSRSIRTRLEGPGGRRVR